MKIQYIRMHIPTGISEICDFPISASRWTVSEFEDKVATWNKMGVVNGLQVWNYRLTVNYRKDD